ncbi:glycosyltransferase family 2 protein [Lusitaniella coriacea LEGE 07157]|uniref:Glucosyl-3-phosphoglycerate synthase n=1 Tax=Lusitaniella coriacea LEGE 07157 TaxID=945747 RepID=A0A8J7DX54_9CYAN|nr:glycosyltransferase family 2 protein [Lusitaniella coriacea]MBE9116871.1 glycosyltransferase family 2 protein [Lusitaniella coriacea LEGE 07157]
MHLPIVSDPKTKQLSIIVPAYNEESTLGITVTEILSIAPKILDTYEVIIVNDGSTDDTAITADYLAQQHSCVSVIHQPTNRGVGAAYIAGLGAAQYEYLTLVPGDNAFNAAGIEALFKAVGTAELLVSYRSNMKVRTPLRHFLSIACTLSMQLLTGRPIRDAHSLYVYPVALARQIKVNPGYGYHIESLSKMLLRAESYKEVQVWLNPRPDESSGVMKPRVIFSLIATMLRQFVERFRNFISRRPTEKVVEKSQRKVKVMK